MIISNTHLRFTQNLLDATQVIKYWQLALLVFITMVMEV